MSHTTTIDGINITDANAIRAAVANLAAKGVNISLVENATPRMYYDHQARDVGTCEFVLKLPDAKYDVGLKQQPDGSYQPVFDEWANSVGGQIGGQCALPQTPEERSLWAIGAFSQEYNKEVVRQQAAAQGMSVSETVDDKGNVHMELVSLYS